MVSHKKVPDTYVRALTARLFGVVVTPARGGLVESQA